MDKVFVFNGVGSQFPAAVFADIDQAKRWIKKYKLTGILNVYLLNIPIYDWAIEKGYFKIKDDRQKESSFIEKFSSASMEHYHFENGETDDI